MDRNIPALFCCEQAPPRASGADVASRRHTVSTILLPQSPRHCRGTSSQILSILFFVQSSSTIASGNQREAQSREGGEMMKWLGSLFCQEFLQGKREYIHRKESQTEYKWDIDQKGHWFERLLQKRIKARRKEKNYRKEILYFSF